MFTVPSAPKSGLKDFFSLKFLKILTILLLSLMAYLFKKKEVKSLIQRYRAGKYLTYINPLFKHQTYSDESCAQTNSCAEPKLLFLKAMAV